MPQMSRERAPQGIMALMQQRGKGAGMQGGKGAGMQGGMPQGGQGGQMDPRMMEMMRRLQGGMPQPAQQTGGMMPPGMAAPGGAQISAMNFTPRPATMGLDGMPIQRANDPQMLAQMQAMQQQGPSGGPGQIDPQMLAAMQAFQQQGGRGGVPMTMPPTGMPQMSRGIAGIDPRMMRGFPGV
jgi:hypothetical protein